MPTKRKSAAPLPSERPSESALPSEPVPATPTEQDSDGDRTPDRPDPVSAMVTAVALGVPVEPWALGWRSEIDVSTTSEEWV